MSNHIKMMLESHRRCASAIQDAANDARKAADASAEEAKEFENMAQQAANRAVEAAFTSRLVCRATTIMEKRSRAD